MKIGFFTDSYLPSHDGVATSTQQCAEALEKRGHEVFIVAPKQPDYKDKRSNIYRLTSIKVNKSPEIRWALQLPEKSLLKLLRTDFDIIHGHSGGGVTFTGLQIARAKNIPYVATYHTLWAKYAHYFLKGRISPRMLERTSRVIGNLCDGLIAPTERVKNELHRYGVKKPIYVLPNGIDLNAFQKVEKGYLHKKRNIPPNTKILLHVGRLGKEKSVDFIIQSFKVIHEKNPHTALVLVGNGSEKEKLQELVKTLGIAKAVYFLGTVNHSTIARVYEDADVFLFASRTETQGMVILEAFAAGLPVIALKDAAFHGVLEDGVNGFSVNKDTKLFANAVLDIVSNVAIYKQFSHAAEETAKRFSIDETAIQLENIYLKMINTNQTRKRSMPSFEDFRSFLVKAKNQILSFEI
jgi:1,2-diacylglycerol 3-alpha-glucosyltransferase